MVVLTYRRKVKYTVALTFRRELRKVNYTIVLTYRTEGKLIIRTSLTLNQRKVTYTVALTHQTEENTRSYQYTEGK